MERRVHQELYCHKGLNKQTIQRLEKCTPAPAQYKFRDDDDDDDELEFNDASTLLGH